MIPYEAPMLSGVDYKSLTDEDEGLFFSLIDLEVGTMENYCDFLTILTPQLKKENLMQTHESDRTRVAGGLTVMSSPKGCQ